MLAEIASANAAIAIIRTAIKNSRDIVNCGQAISQFVNAKADLEKKARKQQRSIFNRSDLDGFFELEKIKQQEKELVEAMQLFGRPGLYQDWVKYQARCRRERLEAIEARRRRNKKIVEIAVIVLLFVLGLFALAALFMWVIYLKSL